LKILGINCLNHDAAISVIEDEKIVFAAHSERYSRIKNDPYLNDDIVDEALSFGKPDHIVYYEKPFLKKSRQLYAGQFKEAFDFSNIPSRYLKSWFPKSKINYVHHHRSHAAAGYYTSGFKDAIVVVVDGIGEWDVVSFWRGDGSKLTKIDSISYPHSIGLFYSAMTQRINLKPCEEEYILMGMSAWGKDVHSEKLKQDFLDYKNLKLKHNIHRGIGNYEPSWEDFDVAASTQNVTEEFLKAVFLKAKSLAVNTENIVYMGGVALNCVANSTILSNMFSNIWIMPNPGDAGSSLGCAASFYGNHLNWEGPLLGTEICSEYPVKEARDLLCDGNIIGIASGKAEFGPRALGNRSLLADPRGPEIKDRVNEIKRRQKFRPFAPAVLEEKAHEIFEMPVKKVPYMQFIAKCKRPDLYPAICHIDNTSRVQTVSKKDNPGFYNLIKEFYKKTGCPMLLNTSLNIKGQPIVNDRIDAIKFSKHYGITVL
jgi:carbamoyltransferase